MRSLLLILAFLAAACLPASAHAHTTVEVEQFSIEVGWGIEPPIVSHRNKVVFDITESGGADGVTIGVKNAFKSLDATAKFGGAAKPLGINADQRAGQYFSDIIPTKTGSYSVELIGEINGTPVHVEIPIEDVESTAILDFPPRQSGGSEDLGPIRQAMSSLQRDVTDLQENGMTVNSPQDSGAAYDFAILGLSLGAAGVILSIIAMTKRK